MATRNSKGSRTFAAALKREPLDMVAVPGGAQSGQNTYALKAEGVCLAPEFNDGDIIICDPDKKVKAGDFVAIWWNNGREPSIKRLVMGIPPKSMWKGSNELECQLIVEQLNPAKLLSAPFKQIDAIHKVIHRMSAERTSIKEGL